MFQANETCEALKERYLMSNIPKRNLASDYHILKKIDQPSWRTTRRNYKLIPQIVYISSRFRALHLLSWEFERSEVLWRYTVINMYVITMAWRCISPWSFHRSLQRRREMDIFHICQQFSTFWSKKFKKKKKRKAGLKIFISQDVWILQRLVLNSHTMPQLVHEFS